MENGSNNQSFWQFSDQLRVQTSNLANLSVNDSIWSSSKSHDARRNFDIKQNEGWNSFKPKASELNVVSHSKPANGSEFNNNFNTGFNGFINQQFDGFNGGINGGFNKGIYSKPVMYSNNVNLKAHKIHGDEFDLGVKKNNNNSSNKKKNDDNNKDVKGDNKFKTLPPSESLPRKETIGGYIFVCNNDTMQENLQRELFGLPPRYRDSVRAITPGLPLFLYNYSTHQLHGIFEAASFGGTNFDASAWEDKKCPGESRFPAQVKILTRKICEPLEEDSFRPILHHYDGPKFRLELSVPEALSLLDKFANQDDIFVNETP